MWLGILILLLIIVASITNESSSSSQEKCEFCLEGSEIKASSKRGDREIIRYDCNNCPICGRKLPKKENS